jgi:hypothetical protein
MAVSRANFKEAVLSARLDGVVGESLCLIEDSDFLAMKQLYNILAKKCC